MDLILLVVLYTVYYLVFPVTLISIVWWVWNKRNTMIGTAAFGSNKKDSSPSKDDLGEIKKLEVFFIVFLLLFIPVMNITSSNLSDISMERDRFYFGAMGQSVIYNPVNERIAPTMDVDSVLEQMEESYEEWYLDDIKAEVDFEDLSRIPGRLAAYHITKRDTEWSHVVLNYHYISPLPITRVIGFRIFEDEGFASLEVDRTIVYPLDPAGSDPF